MLFSSLLLNRDFVLKPYIRRWKYYRFTSAAMKIQEQLLTVLKAEKKQIVLFNMYLSQWGFKVCLPWPCCGTFLGLLQQIQILQLWLRINTFCLDWSYIIVDTLSDISTFTPIMFKRLFFFLNSLLFCCFIHISDGPLRTDLAFLFES